MDHPFFSIVIPVYNTQKELERCVSSITVQTFRDFELILVDDGSTDGSGALCDRLSQADSRIKTIHRENGGCSEARNTGVRAAAGEYLMFVDSDDMWDDADALKELHQIMCRKPVDIVCFGVSIYDEDGSLTKIRKVALPEDCGEDKLSVVRALVYSNQYFSACYVRVYDREFLLKNNLFFVDGLLCEDIEWCARVLLHAQTVAVYTGQFYKRIQRRQGSQTANLGEKNILAILHSIEEGVEYAKQHCENDELLALYYEYWAYQYAMLLGFVPIVEEPVKREELIKRLKKQKWLLEYDHVKKVKAVHYVASLFGVRITSSILSKYYSMNKR